MRYWNKFVNFMTSKFQIIRGWGDWFWNSVIKANSTIVVIGMLVLLLIGVILPLFDK